MKIASFIFLPLGILLSISVVQSQTISTKDYSAHSPGTAVSPTFSPTPASKQGTSKLTGYVFDPNRVLLRSFTITFKNKKTGISETYHTGGKFTIPLENGSYDVRIRDGKGHIGRYSDIIVSSDTSIKFSFANYVEPVTPIKTPTISDNSNSEGNSNSSGGNSNGGNSNGGNSNGGNNNGGNNNGGNSNSGNNNGGRSGGDQGGNSNSDNGNSDLAEDVNANVDSSSNVNSDVIGNTHSENKIDASEKETSADGDKGFLPKLSNFVTENPIKVALTILAALIVAALAVFGIPGAASIAAFAGGLLGGFGLAGKTDAVDDDVKCTLYSAPEVREGSDLLVQVFAHLLEQEDGLNELAAMLDPEAKKQLSKSLKQRIKRDSVLTFKLMIPGIEFEEDEQDLVWRGEPDSVEFIVPIPPDHGDGNRFGRVFVSQNGEELGKIPFRISVVAKAQPIAVEKIEPSALGIMTQNETAFVSYASKDKDHVYRFVQLMDVLKYEYHIDVFSIEAGDRWENKLYEFIDTDDVFLLFWSESASQSEWVIREAKRAEERAKSDPNSLPRIIIYRLDEKVAIPEWLQKFHVDRKWAGMIANIKEKSASAGDVSLP